MHDRRHFLVAGTGIVAGTWAGSLCAEEPEPLASGVKVPKNVTGVVLSPDEKTVITSHWLGKVRFRIWDAAKLTLRHEMPMEVDRALGLRFHPGGRFFATENEAGKVHWWNPENGERIAEFHDPKHDARHLEFTGDGRFMATCNAARGSIRIRNVERKEVCLEIAPPRFNSTNFIALSKSRYLLACFENGVAQVWDLGDGTEARLQCESRRFGKWLIGAHFAEDEQSVEIAFGTEMCRWKLDEKEGYSSQNYPARIDLVAWTTNGSHRVVYLRDDTGELFETSTKTKKRFVLGKGAFQNCCLNRDATRLYTGESFDGDVFGSKPPHPDRSGLCVWDLAKLSQG